MSDTLEPTPPPPVTSPTSAPSGAPTVPAPVSAGPRPAQGGPLLGCAFAVSLLLNVVALGGFLCLCLGALLLRGGTDSGPAPLSERPYSGDSSAREKVAIVHLEGVLLEGLLRFVHQQIDTAAADKEVKAVVLRINSPGGSITASDDLYRRLVELRDGNARKKTNPKPIVVSMGSLAASGGYYAAMPAKTLLAERTTLTGSIGVFATFPNIKGFTDEHKVRLLTIKQGEIKDSGSPFKDMTEKEKQVWQDMVDHAYEQFLAVIEQGRPSLKKEKLLESVEIQPIHAGPHQAGEPPPKQYTRYRADGGIYTADAALKLQLIDRIGTLDDAVQAAHAAAQLGERYQAIEYERPRSLTDLLLGVRTPHPGGLLDPGRLMKGLTPRLWYLAPGYEVSGFLAAVEE